jgi:hypothetical protein
MMERHYQCVQIWNKKMATIQEFLDEYGEDSTTNFQLIKWAKDLGFKLYCVMKNELERFNELKLKKQPVYIICNYQTTSEKGTHWTALYRDEYNSFFFDSYGIQPDLNVISFLEEGVYSTFKIQPYNSKICGVLCLYILYKLYQGEDFYATVLELNEYFN